MQIWEFINYRDYLMLKLGPEGTRSGARKELAEAIGVHTTYVSQVLKGRAEFSLEQAEGINLHFDHSDDEGEYFILLLLKERAGSPPLKKRFDKKILKMREERLNISRRLNVDSTISDKDREKFYSSALYGATHVLCSLPQFRTTRDLAHALSLPLSRMTEIVEFLLRIGLLKSEKDQLVAGTQHVHLGNQSELILKHHINWRMHTISNLQFLDREDLHYSAALSISAADAFKVKEAILETLKRTVEIVGKTKVESAYVLGFDFYKLIGS
jgi:DNA-binding MarR family transcriptional regulator